MIMCRLSKDVISEVLQKGHIYEVGGAVRDRFIFNDDNSKDRDYLVTGIDYDDLSSILSGHGRVDLVGRSFGVIKFTQFRKGQSYTFDLTLPRREFSTGEGHRDFSVDFDPALSVEEDLKRRDFTINAMAMALDSKTLIDPLNGRDDLDQRQIRMVYEDSFSDDPLRMLRAVQFAGRFRFEIEPTTFAAIQQHAHRINTVSPERIADELNKLLVLSKEPSYGFRLMQSSGLLAYVIPELEACVDVDQPGGYHAHNVFEHTLLTIDACAPRLRLRLAALFHDIRKPQHRRLIEGGATFYGHEIGGARTAVAVMRRLRYPNELTEQVEILVERHMFTTQVTDKGLRRFIRRVGVELIFDLLDFRRADVVAQGMGGTTEDVDKMEANIRDELSRTPPFSVLDMALDGEDVMKMFGIPPGPKVGYVLDQLLEKVLDVPGDNTKEVLEKLARKIYDDKYPEISSTDDEVKDK